MALGAWLGGLAGCGGAADGLTPEQAPLPIRPVSDPQVAPDWYYGWVTQEDRTPDGAPREMLLISTTRGRDWRPPDGPDGYALRAVLLDRSGRAVRAPGSFRVFLVREPDRATSEALLAWEIPPDEAARRFHEGILDGYVLQLDCGWGPPGVPPAQPAAGPLPRPGAYMLVVRWTAADGSGQVTRTVAFQDRIESEWQDITTQASE